MVYRSIEAPVQFQGTYSAIIQRDFNIHGIDNFILILAAGLLKNLAAYRLNLSGASITRTYTQLWNYVKVVCSEYTVVCDAQYVTQWQFLFRYWY